MTYINRCIFSIRYHGAMDMMTMLVGGALTLLLSGFVLRLCYTITINLINGRKFHHSLEQSLDKLRLSRMINALGINKTAYIYQTNVNDIHKQMDSCSACINTDACDEKLSAPDVDLAEIAFCNNEADLKEIKRQQSESNATSKENG